MIKIADFIEEIGKKTPTQLAIFARWIDDGGFYRDVQEENEFSDAEMREMIMYTVKRMMHLNLVIPSDGTEVNLLAVAQDLHDDPEFGGKYDALAEEIEDEA